MRNRSRLVLLLMLLLISACGSSGELTVQDAWARPASAGDNGAAYFIIENGTAADDTLLSVRSDIAASTEVHISMESDRGVMSMQMLESVVVSAGDKVEFKPGDLHVMFVNLTRELKISDTFMLTLHFENTGEMTLPVEVKEQ